MQLKPDGHIVVEAGGDKYKLNYYRVKESMKKNTLYNEPFDHERYERDTDAIGVALLLLIMAGVCAMIYIIGVALMG